jgi:hypothetical protein
MSKAMSQMSEEELDFLYEAALQRETHFSFLDDESMHFEEDNDSDFDIHDAFHAAYGDTWTDEDEAALEAWEIQRRERIAIRNEY